MFLPYLRSIYNITVFRSIRETLFPNNFWIRKFKVCMWLFPIRNTALLRSICFNFYPHCFVFCVLDFSLLWIPEIRSIYLGIFAFYLVNVVRFLSFSDGGFGNWGNWGYVAGSSCSASCGTGGVQLQSRTRLCDNPTRLGQGLDCATSGLIEFTNSSCQNPLPPCGTYKILFVEWYSSSNNHWPAI